jgi:hypothetical protein
MTVDRKHGQAQPQIHLWSYVRVRTEPLQFCLLQFGLFLSGARNLERSAA